MTDKQEEQQEQFEALGIASALLSARTELGMTQAQLSEASGISRSAIKGYETGRNMPGSRELKALCKVLRVTPTFMLFGTETPFTEATAQHTNAAELRLIVADPESAKQARMRVAALADLLTSEEVSSLLTLVQALAVARHSEEVVAQRLSGADILASLGAAMINEGARVAVSGGEVDADRIVSAVEASLLRAEQKPKIEGDEAM